MASDLGHDGHDGSPVVPTAIPLGTAFPYPNARGKSSSTSLVRHSATEDTAPSNNTQQHRTLHNSISGGTTSPLRPGDHLETTSTTNLRPQLVQKSQTEGPTVRTNTSPFTKTRSATSTRPNRPSRTYTYTFDPYSSSDSSSSSDEDEVPPAPDGGLAGGEKKRHSIQRKTEAGRRRSSSDPYSRFQVGNDHFKTKGKVSKRDGRLKISVNETVNSGYLAKALGAGLKKHFMGGQKHEGEQDALSPVSEPETKAGKIPPEEDEMEWDPKSRVKLNIVVMVIGSRGDIQPFLKIGKILKEEYGHRVRIATHPAFKKFVEQDSGLEFFSVGGDPSELMAFMVKNPGLIPSVETVKAGEIGRRRAAMYDMFQGMWRACINATDDETDEENMKMMGDKHPFVADAIIANPPSFAPAHIAERLGVPLHEMFTFPYTPTTQFPHPLANIKKSNVDSNYTNFMSYPLVEMMTWQGLGDLINRFRVKTLGLEPVSTLWAPGQLYRLKVPYTYLWSPSLVPKPHDWGPEIDIAGFVFLELASSFKPPDALTNFLDAGPPPIYIGFGSIVVDDPDKFTQLIFEAVEMAGVRALVSKGWGGLGDKDNTPDNIFMLENTPHDWLFPRVSAVVHHGGAGTTAIGLKCGKPTMIVPFFGDQPFWGDMVSKAKAGAHECIPYKKLTTERLANGIKQCLTDEARANVKKIADSIAREGDGAANAVKSFHRSLPLRGAHNMRCSIFKDRVATWQLKNTDLRLSPLAAEVLVEMRKIRWSELRLLRHYEWNDFGGPGEPLTGGGSAIIGTVTGAAKGVGLIPVKMARSVKRREEHWEKKRKVKKRQKVMVKVPARQNDNDANGSVNGEDNHASQRNNSSTSLQRAETNVTELSADPEENIVEELAHEATHGIGRTGAALAKGPMDLSLAVAQGFHNAPRLYGDETVRRPIRISGFHSGLRAGRDEFVYGIYDGVTGLWLHPYHGARSSGPLGFLQGICIGLGGFVLKDIAAFIGPVAYTLKGLHKEIQKSSQLTAFLRRARIIQGQKDLAEITKASKENKNGKSSNEREEVNRVVMDSWNDLQRRIENERRRNEQGWRRRLGLVRSKKKGGADVPRKGSTMDLDGNADSKPARGRGATTPESLTAQKWKEKSSPAPAALKTETKLAGAGLAPGKVARDDQSHRAASDADGDEKVVNEQGKLTSENRSTRTSVESRRRAATDTIDFAAVKAGMASGTGITANGSV